MITIPFNNSYADLGDVFYQYKHPSQVESPGLIVYNHELGRELRLPDFNDESEIASIFSGNEIPQGSTPLAMAYAGHQFGNFVPQLGDGRALLLGQLTATDGMQYDIHLKGSGQTRYSRNGDGRSALGPVLREYLLSEAMARLNVPTTRALAAVTTGDEVVRERLKPGGVITRVSRSFVRVGTFQFFAYRDDIESIRKLADYIIAYVYPQLKQVDRPYETLLAEIVDRQAALIARWMQLGFIHGVMNTDNMSIAGETIDYGPCAFMDYYRHDMVYSSIDRYGRYAYNQQPDIALWNLTRLAETLLPLLADKPEAAVEIATDILKRYVDSYQQYWLLGMRKKIGLISEQDSDRQLIEELLKIMHTANADFTLTFFTLSELEHDSCLRDDELNLLFNCPEPLGHWLEKWRQRLKQDETSAHKRKVMMRSVNPVYIPRNHQVEAAIRAAEDQRDFSVFTRLHEVLKNPYERQARMDRYMAPPQPHEIVQQTFCGT